MKKSNTAKIIERYRAKIRPENRQFVSKNLQISNQISEILARKGWSQKEFASRLGKKESEVSKWLSGLHNLTLQSVAKMEAVLGEDILLTPGEACRKYTKIEYVTLRVNATQNQPQMPVSPQMDTRAIFRKIKEGKIA